VSQTVLAFAWFTFFTGGLGSECRLSIVCLGFKVKKIIRKQSRATSCLMCNEQTVWLVFASPTAWVIFFKFFAARKELITAHRNASTVGPV